jgi:hypothetical protein
MLAPRAARMVATTVLLAVAINTTLLGVEAVIRDIDVFPIRSDGDREGERRKSVYGRGQHHRGHHGRGVVAVSITETVSDCAFVT